MRENPAGVFRPSQTAKELASSRKSRSYLVVATDAKIQDVALAYIRKAKNVKTSPWPSTTLGELHPSLAGRLSLDEGELVLVSGFFSDASWYAFTTRRIVSQFGGKLQSLDPSHGIDDQFGNFKGYGEGSSEPGVVRREVATITGISSGAKVRFEFETWDASMLPIYAARYWNIKHPVIDKLMTTAERESHKAREN